MEITTARFGNVQIEEKQIIHIPSGIIGFPEDPSYVLREHRPGSPFLWLQSIDHGNLAFVLTDPFLFFPDYEFEISPDDLSSLELKNGLEGIQIFVIVNILNGSPLEVTANLLGPIILNSPKKLAKQIVLSQSAYSCRHPLPLSQKSKAP